MDGPSQNLFCNDGGSWEGHVIEAPFPYRQGDTFYLFYSGNDYGEHHSALHKNHVSVLSALT